MGMVRVYLILGNGVSASAGDKKRLLSLKFHGHCVGIVGLV